MLLEITQAARNAGAADKAEEATTRGDDDVTARREFRVEDLRARGTRWELRREHDGPVLGQVGGGVFRHLL